MSKQPHTELLIDGFEIELDCPEEERKTLEDKLNLIALGNGKDLCLLSCDETDCKAAKLIVRHYDNVDKSGLENGGIEIESDYTSLIANNCNTYHVPGKEFLHLTFAEKGLLVRIVYASEEND